MINMYFHCKLKIQNYRCIFSLFFIVFLFITCPAFSQVDQPTMVTLIKQNQALTKAFISVLKQNETNTKTLISMMNQNQEQMKLLIQIMDNSIKQQNLLLSQLQKGSTYASSTTHERVTDQTTMPRQPLQTTVASISEPESDVPQPKYSPPSLFGDARYKPYQLQERTLIYSKKRTPMMRLKTPVLVSLHSFSNDDYHSIQFESWIIESYKGKRFVTILPEGQVKTLCNMNTRSAPSLKSDDKIGTIYANNTFQLLRKKEIGVNTWLEINVDALVRKTDIRR